jgi:F1F0 ATPase subunit 2
MNEFLMIILVFIAGLLLGILFFGGLWLTVKKALTSKFAAVWFLGSFLVRTGATLIGFYFISLGNWQRLLVCLIGFVIARYIVTHLTKPNTEKQLALNQGACNGS